MKKALKGIALAAALSCGLMLAACSGTTTVVADALQTGITVNATATVKVVPDKASFQVEVLVQGDTADEAQAASAEPVNAVLATLREAGVDDKSIQTAYTDLSPLYDWSAGIDTIVGYQMRTMLAVSDVSVDQVSALMEACVAAGATSVDGPSYASSGYDEAYEQALAEAVAAAKPKAEAMAEASGVKLGQVISIVEGYQNTSFRYMEAAATEDSFDKGTGGTEIAPGEVSIEAQVTVTYAIG